MIRYDQRYEDAKLDAVHGKLSNAVLAWIATENEARERGAGGRCYVRELKAHAQGGAYV